MNNGVFVPCQSLERCCGCGLCQNICQNKAIKLVLSTEGFLVPTIDSAICINCGLCSKKCLSNSISKSAFSLRNPLFYYAFSNDKKIRASSASGGIASTIYNVAIDLSWYVCGVTYKNNNLVFLLTNEREKIHYFSSSKYIQSNPTDIYLEIKKIIDSGKFVFFVGTPCQVYALKALVGNPDNLFTADLVCYGVGSERFYKDYLSSFNKNKDSKIENFIFRKKICGTLNSFSIIKFDNGVEKKKMFYTSVFGKLFSKHLITRKSCDNCPFDCYNRVGDITLGDYVENNSKLPISELKKGCSLVRINSVKGEKLFKLIEDRISFDTILEKDIKTFLVRQGSNHLITSNRDAFFKDYTEYGYNYCVKKYYNISRRELIRMRFCYFLKAIKRIVKRKE